MLRILTILLALAAPASDDPARELARRIAAFLAPRETVALSVRNVSQMTPAEVAAARRGIESQLRAAGFPLAPAGPATVAITFSENGQGRLWIAEIRHGDKRDVVMLVPQRAPERTVRTPLAIERQAILEQPAPILDVAVLDQALLVLEPAQLVVYRRQETRWERKQALPTGRNNWPRDVRGQIHVEGETFQAFLPGVVCTGKLAPEAAMECADSDAPWPGGAKLIKGRNYFEGDFYSSARLGDVVVTAGLDGRVRTSDGASISGWGADLVAVETACGRHVLSTRAGEPGEADAVQAFDIAGRQPSAVSPALAFNGPVTALWPLPPSGAIAVSRDLKTGQYAAYRLTVTCSR